MTRKSSLPSPEPWEINKLLHKTQWSTYEAARKIGITGSAFQKAVRGETRLRGGLWHLLQIYASQAARDTLPPPPLE